MKKFKWCNLLDLFLRGVYFASLLSSQMALNSLLEYDLVD